MAHPGNVLCTLEDKNAFRSFTIMGCYRDLQRIYLLACLVGSLVSEIFASKKMTYKM
jgi:hypothetical protein